MLFEEEVDFAAEEEASRFLISLVGVLQTLLETLNMSLSIRRFLCISQGMFLDVHDGT